MKAILLVLLLVPTLVAGADFSLGYNATFVPPHHEPVVGDRVARYRLQLVPMMESRWFDFTGNFNIWGVNEWQDSQTAGDGWGDADWSIDKWRYSAMYQVTFYPFDTKTIGLFTEYYRPFHRHSWGGHGMERHYYWLIGLSGTIKLFSF